MESGLKVVLAAFLVLPVGACRSEIPEPSRAEKPDFVVFRVDDPGGRTSDPAAATSGRNGIFAG